MVHKFSPTAEDPRAEVIFQASRTEPRKSCDLCGGERFETISRHDRQGHPLDTVICTRCGLVVHRQVPSEEELLEFYAQEYRQQYHGETAPSPRRVMRAWQNGQRIFRQLAPYLESGTEVLEVGAGLGCNVQAFAEAGFSARGIDPGQAFQQYARVNLRAKVSCCSLFDLPVEPQADLVLLVHVIEHFRSPFLALARIQRLLRPNGRLYVECPNLAAPFATRRRLFHVAHIHNFTPSSLQMMAEKSGFRVEARLSSPEDPNLQMLLRLAPHGRLNVDSHNYARTLEVIDRYNLASYHLRKWYLRDRARKLGTYLWEHLAARSFVRRLEDRLAAQFAVPDAGPAASRDGGQARSAA